MSKRVSDEKLLSCLLVHGGVSATASALNLTKGAIYKRLQDPSFKAQYDAAQDLLVEVATTSMTDALEGAIGVLRDVMNDSEAAPGVRVSAADSLLRHCSRYIETANILRRIEKLEQRTDPDSD